MNFISIRKKNTVYGIYCRHYSVNFHSTSIYYSIFCIKANLDHGKTKCLDSHSDSLFFMAIRRGIPLFRIISGDMTHHPDPVAELVALIILIFMLIGVVWIAPIFLSIEHTKEELKSSGEGLFLYIYSQRG